MLFFCVCVRALQFFLFCFLSDIERVSIMFSIFFTISAIQCLPFLTPTLYFRAQLSYDNSICPLALVQGQSDFTIDFKTVPKWTGS